jgi:hypothetical protein
MTSFDASAEAARRWQRSSKRIRWYRSWPLSGFGVLRVSMPLSVGPMSAGLEHGLRRDRLASELRFENGKCVYWLSA